MAIISFHTSITVQHLIDCLGKPESEQHIDTTLTVTETKTLNRCEKKIKTVNDVTFVETISSFMGREMPSKNADI